MKPRYYADDADGLVYYDSFYGHVLQHLYLPIKKEILPQLFVLYSIELKNLRP